MPTCLHDSSARLVIVGLFAEARPQLTAELARDAVCVELARALWRRQESAGLDALPDTPHSGYTHRADGAPEGILHSHRDSFRLARLPGDGSRAGDASHTFEAVFRLRPGARAARHAGARRSTRSLATGPIPNCIDIWADNSPAC